MDNSTLYTTQYNTTNNNDDRTSKEDDIIREPGLILGLREQIKANAGLLFQNATGIRPQLGFDVVVQTSPADTFSAEKLYTTPPEMGAKYQAILVYRSSPDSHANDVAASGPSSDTVTAALQSLLHVLAVAIEKYFSRAVSHVPKKPVEIAGGVIDESRVWEYERAKVKKWF